MAAQQKIRMFGQEIRCTRVVGEVPQRVMRQSPAETFQGPTVLVARMSHDLVIGEPEFLAVGIITR